MWRTYRIWISIEIPKTTKRAVIVEQNKPTLEEMWKFIDHIMRPNELVPDKSVFTYDNVFVIYTKLKDIDETFREILQINILKREIEQEKNSVAL